MTNVNVVYGNEEYDYIFLDTIRKRGRSLQSLFKETSESAAKYFVELANSLEEITDREQYYRNIGKLCLDLSLKEGFYEALTAIVEEAEVSERAALILHNL